MFAGQITGCEGYVESASIGWLAGYFASCILKNKTPLLPPRETAFGCQLAHLIDDTDVKNYQPMNINFGLFPELPKQLTAKGKLRHLKGAEKKQALTSRALQSIEEWIKNVE